MKTQQLFTLVALASSATATFDWLDAKQFSCPQNTDNKCIDKQKSGFKWEGLDLGKFTKFADFDFSGFECADSFDGLQKRDLITGRTFQNKCIKGTATEELPKAPSFGCGSSKQVDKFSVKTFQVSVEYDVDLEFHYGMPDGSLCKQKQKCQKSGTIVNNTQCGGAKTVTIVVPKGQGKDKGTKGRGCDVGFHDIEFDCEPSKNTPPKSSSTTTPPASTTTPALSSSTTPIQSSSTTPAQSSTTTPAVSSSTTPAQSSTTAPADSSSTTPAQSSTTSSPVGSQTGGIPTPQPTPGPSTTSDSSPVESTSTPPFPQNTTTPGENTPVVTPPASATVSTFTEVHTSTITSCGADVISCPAGSPPASVTTPSVPIPTTDCPPVLPQCLNTWLFASQCKSNTDADCFCKSTNFVQVIYQCLSAYGADDEEISKAQNFFQGICAPHVPQNPAIITGATTLTITAAPITSIPVTTIELQTTVTVPCIQTVGPSSGATIPGSSTTMVISTAVTVPQVVFQTITGSITNAVSLVQGTPTAPATNIIVPTTFASVINNSTATFSGRPPTFTGAASRTGFTASGVFLAGVAAAALML